MHRYCHGGSENDAPKHLTGDGLSLAHTSEFFMRFGGFHDITLSQDVTFNFLVCLIRMLRNRPAYSLI